MRCRRNFPKQPEKFGTGHVEGVIESGAANNSALSGAWIPALVFGIPGDSITAIAIGVLYMKNMNPGPTIFINNPENIYAVFIVFFLANLLMLPLGVLAIKSYKQVLKVPRAVLMPVILLFCTVGAYAINNSAFDIGIMLAFGLLAFVMEENDFPVAPVILGAVLGRMLEENFVTSMIKADGQLLCVLRSADRGRAGHADDSGLVYAAYPQTLKVALSRPGPGKSQTLRIRWAGCYNLFAAARPSQNEAGYSISVQISMEDLGTNET